MWRRRARPNLPCAEAETSCHKALVANEPMDRKNLHIKVLGLLESCRSGGRDFVASAEADLLRLGEDAGSVLAAALHHANATVRCNALWGLDVTWQSVREAAVPAMIQALDDADPGVRRNAAGKLGDIVWRQQSAWWERQVGFGEWVKESAQRAVVALMIALRDDDESMREEAASSLGGINCWSKDAVPSLIESLRDRSNTVVQVACWALTQIGNWTWAVEQSAAPVKKIIPPLIELLQHEDGSVRKQAIWSFQEFRELAHDAVPALVDVLRHGQDSDLRAEVCRALADIGATAGGVLQAIVPALVEAGETDPSESVQTSAILALDKARPRGRGLSLPSVRRSDLAIVPRKQRRRGLKREDAEALKSLLAFLNACVNWPGDVVSQRELRKSPLLKEERKRLGLPEKISAGTVHNHLKTLARLCKVERIWDPEPKNQFSTFRAGVKERLLQRRPYIEEEIAIEEEKAGLQAYPERLGPTPPEPDAIA